jgi:hypothetical protein
MALVFYYLTEDSNNPKEQNEVNYLRKIGRVVIVTRGFSSGATGMIGVKKLVLSAQSPTAVRAFSVWTKVCYLLARSSDSLTDRNFPARNLYTGHIMVRRLINCLWPIKYLTVVNRLLPAYEALYFLPFKVARLFVFGKRRASTRFKRVVVHDSLILRLTQFTFFILMARRSGFHMIANVKSWDNPFYSQFIRSASGYLTWSQCMWGDIRKVHRVNTSANHSWGPRPFCNFTTAVRVTERRASTKSDTLTIGYAAAFCDSLMAQHEVRIVSTIAKHLEASGIGAKILVRPYPVVPMSTYEPLLNYSNIELVGIQGRAFDRYGDGREIIRFGSDEERMLYLSRCDCFLSIATSFTFEAAIFGLPIVQYFVPKERRRTDFESVFFGRLDISDHILNYFLKYLRVARDPAELWRLIEASQNQSHAMFSAAEMMAAMGFPPVNSSWDERADRVIAELNLR